MSPSYKCKPGVIDIYIAKRVKHSLLELSKHVRNQKHNTQHDLNRKHPITTTKIVCSKFMSVTFFSVLRV